MVVPAGRDRAVVTGSGGGASRAGGGASRSGAGASRPSNAPDPLEFAAFEPSAGPLGSGSGSGAGVRAGGAGLGAGSERGDAGAEELAAGSEAVDREGVAGGGDPGLVCEAGTCSTCWSIAPVSGARSGLLEQAVSPASPATASPSLAHASLVMSPPG